MLRKHFGFGTRQQWILLPVMAGALLFVGWQATHDYHRLNTPFAATPQQLLGSQSDIEHSAPRSLSSLYLMGKPAEEAPVVEEVIEELPETRLDFMLKGVFASKENQLGGAVIDTGKEEPAFYQIGDELVEHVVLADIHARGVVLDREGKRELLSFEESVFQVDHFSRRKNHDAVVRYRSSVNAASANTDSTESSSTAQVATSRQHVSREEPSQRMQTLRDRLSKLRKQQ